MRLRRRLSFAAASARLRWLMAEQYAGYRIFSMTAAISRVPRYVEPRLFVNTLAEARKAGAVPARPGLRQLCHREHRLRHPSLHRLPEGQADEPAEKGGSAGRSRYARRHRFASRNSRCAEDPGGAGTVIWAPCGGQAGPIRGAACKKGNRPGGPSDQALGVRIAALPTRLSTVCRDNMAGRNERIADGQAPRWPARSLAAGGAPKPPPVPGHRLGR